MTRKEFLLVLLMVLCALLVYPVDVWLAKLSSDRVANFLGSIDSALSIVGVLYLLFKIQQKSTSTVPTKSRRSKSTI